MKILLQLATLLTLGFTATHSLAQAGAGSSGPISTGKVLSVDAKTGVMTIFSNQTRGPITFYGMNEANVGTGTGTPATFATIQKDMPVTVHYATQGGRLVVSKVSIPDPSAPVSATVGTAPAAMRPGTSPAARDGDITTQPGSNARRDGDITTQPGSNARRDGDITTQPGSNPRRDGDITTKPGSNARKDGDITTQPGSKARVDNDITTKPGSANSGIPVR